MGPAAKRIIVTGASGLVGRTTVRHLLAHGHHVIAASRNPANHDWPAGVETIRWVGPDAAPVAVDGIINLAGASIGGKRWTKAYKQDLLVSRLWATQGAVATADRDRAPLVTASATGIYGMDPEGVCHEDRKPGLDFLAHVCTEWEAAARAAQGRVAILRFGQVLSADGEGILGRLVPLYKARLGGRIGSGKQGLPWVHVEDVARALVWALEGQAAGAYNLAAPGAATQTDLDRELGRVLGVAHPWRIPGIAMRVAAGELGPYLVGGQATPPDRLLQQGFTFKHPALGPALDDLFGHQTV